MNFFSEIKDSSLFPKTLWVLKATYFNPTWERTVSGKRIDQIDFYQLNFLRKVLVSASWVRQTRANPRSHEYMLDAAMQIFGSGKTVDKVDLLIETSEVPLAEEWQKHFGHIYKANAENYHRMQHNLVEELKQARYDMVVLLYEDAIGLGWENVERLMERIQTAQVIVLNGRKRIFKFDKVAKRKLVWRRFLETSWLSEVVLAPLLVVCSLAFFVYDVSLGKLGRG